MSESEASDRIGILGGGQLALMLSEAAIEWGLQPVVFASSADEPAYRFLGRGVVGPLTNENLFEQFLSLSETYTFESDFLPFDVLEKYSSKNFVPSLSLLRRLSSKIEQKKIFEELKIPSAPYQVFTGEDLEGWVQNSLDEFKGDAVFKWDRGGYDGKGVYLSERGIEGLLVFLNEALKKNVRVFVEAKADFQNEISQVSVHSTKGDLRFYPLVFSRQEKGICRSVWGPARSFGFPEKVETEIQSHCRNLGSGLSLFGSFAIEFFHLKSGEFWANEIAPRVHNTGHFSIDCGRTSQFENHIRAVMGMSLGDTSIDSCFFMQNILGDRQLKISELPALPERPQFHLKWYNKKEMRPGRKMGHMNRWGFQPEELEKIRQFCEDYEKEWLAHLK